MLGTRFGESGQVEAARITRDQISEIAYRQSVPYAWRVSSFAGENHAEPSDI